MVKIFVVTKGDWISKIKGEEIAWA